MVVRYFQEECRWQKRQEMKGIKEIALARASIYTLADSKAAKEEKIGRRNECVVFCILNKFSTSSRHHKGVEYILTFLLLPFLLFLR